jgi:hypothetical protein
MVALDSQTPESGSISSAVWVGAGVFFLVFFVVMTVLQSLSGHLSVAPRSRAPIIGVGVGKFSDNYR